MSDDIHFAQVEDEPYVALKEIKNGESWAAIEDAQGVILTAGTLEELVTKIAAELRVLDLARAVVDAARDIHFVKCACLCKCGEDHTDTSCDLGFTLRAYDASKEPK